MEEFVKGHVALPDINICRGNENISHSCAIKKNTYVLLNLRALKFQALYKNRIFQYMRKLFCVEFQRYYLKLHTKYLANTMKDVYFVHG